MSDWSAQFLESRGAYVVLSSGGEGSPLADAVLNAGGIMRTSAVWPTANLAFYVPILVRDITTIFGYWWYNGATVSGNVDCGIYDFTHTQLGHTGSTVQAGTSTVQSVAAGASFSIQPGLYYLALAMDNVTGTMFRSGTLGTLAPRVTGVAQQATAFPLPASATFQAAGNNIPLFGCYADTSVF